MIPQVIANGIVASALIIPVSLGLFLVYSTHRFIFFAYGAVVMIAPYVSWLLVKKVSLPLWFAGLIGVSSAVLLGWAIEATFHAPARKRGMGSLPLLLLSIGCYAVIQNAVSLSFGNDILSFRDQLPQRLFVFGKAFVTNFQLGAVFIALFCTTAVAATFRLTSAGKCMRAVANCEVLSRIVGINTEFVYFSSMGAGCLLGGLAGVLIACDTDITPTMGMMPLMIGWVAPQPGISGLLDGGEEGVRVQMNDGAGHANSLDERFQGL
jgi:branched-subunit amino acid ABC-type transport system permease component